MAAVFNFEAQPVEANDLDGRRHRDIGGDKDGAPARGVLDQHFEVRATFSPTSTSRLLEVDAMKVAVGSTPDPEVAALPKRPSSRRVGALEREVARLRRKLEPAEQTPKNKLCEILGLPVGEEPWR